MKKPINKVRKPIVRRKNRTNAATGAAEAKAQLNRIEAFKLRVAGKNIRQIAETLRVAISTAHGYLHAEAAELTVKEGKMRETYKTVEDARLTALIEKVLPLATRDGLVVARDDGEGGVIYEDAAELQLKAVAQAIKISERLSRLHGLDAPTKQEHSGPEGGPITYALTKERQAELAARGRRLLEMVPRPQSEGIVVVGDN